MNIQELDAYNLADAVKFNDRLNPRIWDASEHLKPEVRERLLAIAEDFTEFLGLSDLDVKDITVSGSNAAYTYTPNSDIDLHIVAEFPEDEVYRELFDAKKAQYNDQHNIKIGGYDVELYVETAGQPPVSQGMYSVLNNDWIQVPRRVKANVDDTSTKNKFESVGRAIERAVKSGDLKRMDRLAKKIKKMRQTGLEAHGEFGPENLAFKMLRSQGKIKELHDARIAAKDQELSLKERKQPHSIFTYGFKHEDKINEVSLSPDGVSPSTKMFLSENEPTDEEILQDFIEFCVEELKIKQMPIVKLRKDPQWSVVNKTFGRYTNEKHLLEVAWGQRHIMDVLRTVAHELTHKHQHERDGARMGNEAGETGSPWENEANARAGVLMRDYGRMHPELFDAGQAEELHGDEVNESASGYIPTKKQARDPRFSMALTVDIKPGQVGKEANKLKLKTDSQGHPQIANPNGLFEKLALELNQFKKKGTLVEEQLDEVRMAPSNLMQWAKSPEAEGVRAGFEAELIFRDTSNGDGDEEMEPDYDMDERCHSIQQIVDFFQSGDYGYMSDRQAARLTEELDEKYYEWYDDQRYQEWQDNREELVRDALLEDTPMEERIHAYLVDGMELTDEQADAIQALAKKREDGKIKGSDMSEEQLDMISAYSEARSGADDILDEDVESCISSEDTIYERAKEDFDDSFSIDDDSGFFSDTGLRWMSDISSEFDLDWPYMTGSGGNDGSRDWEGIGDSLHEAVGMPVKVSSGYHQATRKEGMWIVEPDSSLEPDDREDYGLEIVSPPMPLLTALDKLQEVCDWANSDEGNAYTNSSTGLHMGVSVPFKGGNVDYVKLILFLGDEYVLQSFGREANTYCASAIKKLKQNVGNSNARYAANVGSAMELMRGNLIELANREIQKGVGESKYTSVHIQKGYIEFRSAGGDWLAEESADPEKLQSTMLRYARAMSLAANPAAERREYAKKLYKLIAPEGNDQLALFSQFTAGELDKERLKKLWAEKTIGTEKKMNQRWKLYKKVDGVWTTVPGAEWNGYTEDQVKNAVWSKYGREALDSGEYQLVNTSEGQEWEIYDVKTGKTLEVVKAKNKGEAADAVYDKYVDQGIGFQVRPYEDPAKMTPRAKLAKRIVQPKEKTDWDVIYKPTGRVIDNILSVDREQAQKLLAKVATLHDFKNSDDLEIRPQTAGPSGDWVLALANGEVLKDYRGDPRRVFSNMTKAEALRQAQADSSNQHVLGPSAHYPEGRKFDDVYKIVPLPVEKSPDVAQNFDQPQDATSRVGTWAIYDVTLGREISRMDNVPWSQADARANELERSTGHNISVRGLSENFADGKGPGRPGDSQRHGIPKGATMAELEKASHASGRKGQLARWQLNMRRGKKK